MFTVIVCDEHIIKDCYQKYHIFFKPFLDSDNFSFCEWNHKGDTLEEALPGLKDLIRHRKEWRAIIVNDSSTWGFDAVNKRNPFNYVDSVNHSFIFSDFDHILDFRSQQKEKYRKALNNPLTKLSSWLCGIPFSAEPIICYEQEKDTIEHANNGDVYYDCISKLKLDSFEVEMDYDKELRFKTLTEKFELNGELFNLPKSVIALSERAECLESKKQVSSWGKHTEFDYSTFYADNLYSDKLRYMLFDISYLKGEKSESMYFDFLTMLLMLACYDVPQGIMRANRVYRLEMESDRLCIGNLCEAYNSKLRATLSKIETMSVTLREREKQPIDRQTVEDVFEADISIPIEVISTEGKGNLMAKHDRIGLSGDCPEDEYENWSNQFHTINKYFIRFLREPRRAVKSATKDKFRAMNTIDDSRAARLNEYQKEDIAYVLDEEERNMVNTTTAHLFNTAKYNNQMRDAEKEIKNCIAQRMTRRKTVTVGLISLAAYLFGFLPLIISNFNTVKSLLFSLTLTGAVLGIFAVIGFLYLFVLRKKLVEKFEKFNMVMRGIITEVESGVKTFSDYLSHACNVMRKFSILNYAEKTEKKEQNILENHKRDINEKIKEVNELFSSYISLETLELRDDAEPYDYDFTAMRSYEYEIPYVRVNRDIDFLQQGNIVNIPVDYVKSISLKREELYD